MTENIKREIERLLDEPGDRPGTGPLRARLAATLSEGLETAAPDAPDAEASDQATLAAFVEGRLAGAERDRFVAALARNQSLRADAESSAALIQSITDNPTPMPKELLARAGALLEPAPRPRRAEPTSRWQLAAFLPRRPVAWALAAVLAVLVLSPAALYVGGRFGGVQPQTNGEPELTSVPDAEDDDPQQPPQACEDKSKPGAKSEAAQSNLPPREIAKPAAPAGKDPCDKPTPDDNKVDK